LNALFKGFIIGLAGFGAFHILILLLIFVKFLEMGYFKKIWPKIEPQIIKLENLKKEENSLEANAKIIDQLTRKNISWASGLCKISKVFPSGVWFDEFILMDNTFIIKGKIVSKNQDLMTILNKLINGLRSITDFSTVDLGPVKNINYRNQEVMSFEITGKTR
jgi:hypothetical protein